MAYTVSDETYATNRQTDTTKNIQKNLTFLAAAAAGESPTKLGIGLVIEDLQHVLAPVRLLGDLMHSFAATGR